MIIKCITCKKDFEQIRGERTCGCRPSKYRSYESTRIAAKLWVKENYDSPVLRAMNRYYQNPIYQWIREFITSETFTHYKSFYKQALRF